MHLFVACALTVPPGSSDRGCVHRNGSLPIIWLSVNRLARKNMLSAHDYDRQLRGWFSSQIPDLVRRRGTPSIGCCPTPIFNSAAHFSGHEARRIALGLSRKNAPIWARFRIAIRYSLQRNLSLALLFLPLSSVLSNSVLEMFPGVAYSLPPRSFLPQ
jgi:hypothetical protein